ncbi:hypothetical protein [Ruegeria jejuensis]|uniref:hypothetical protein n=1 Tax=Ruegeria jejuensis TaxID=3233338 RepID=UPI00355AE0BE
MKRMIAALMAVPILAACSDLTPEQKTALVAEAVFIADAMQDEGETIVDLSPEQLAVLESACRLGPVFAPEEIATIETVCAAVKEATQ